MMKYQNALTIDFRSLYLNLLIPLKGLAWWRKWKRQII